MTVIYNTAISPCWCDLYHHCHEGLLLAVAEAAAAVDVVAGVPVVGVPVVGVLPELVPACCAMN